MQAPRLGQILRGCDVRARIGLIALVAAAHISLTEPVAAQNAPPRQGPQLQTGARLNQPGGAPPQQGPAGPGQPAGAQGYSQPPAPQPPFVLDAQQQQILNQILANWEKQSATVESLQCELHRWEQGGLFPNANPNGGNAPPKDPYAIGELKYTAPDKGKYLLHDSETKEVEEHWVCDGKAIYEFDHAKELLTIRPLPPELQGKAIADGPLPFLFGAQADKLKARYWIRAIEPPQAAANMICLEAYPKYQRDAANFRRAEVLLDPNSWMPFSLMLENPNGKSRTVHVFKEPKVNSFWQGVRDSILSDTKKPVGWTQIVERPPANPAGPAPQPGAAPAGAPQGPPRAAMQPRPSTAPPN